ncbi:MAG: hypothetical protein GWN87_03995 [Desulfuromonadales bacterium]|nr:hypothetical protein [Desulfuromonadales bacterium]NIS39786.1 hypothetical protein [Desulfuromonadales bacterium]
MKRFRFTLVAVCLFLIWLGWTDVELFLRNRQPAEITVEELVAEGPPREWMHVSGGHQDIEQAISTSGSIDLDALLVPLKVDPADERIHVLFETRNPEIMKLFSTYHFKTDSALEKEAFIKEHSQEFHARRDITGMLITGLIATSNRDKLLSLTEMTDLPVAEDVILISEGKTPATMRGFFFLGTGLLGLIFIVLQWRKKARNGGTGSLSLED